MRDVRANLPAMRPLAVLLPSGVDRLRLSSFQSLIAPLAVSATFKRGGGA